MESGAVPKNWLQRWWWLSGWAPCTCWDTPDGQRSCARHGRGYIHTIRGTRPKAG